jgi:hypothetical protein
MRACIYAYIECLLYFFFPGIYIVPAEFVFTQEMTVSSVHLFIRRVVEDMMNDDDEAHSR